ncbi:50S ribosomal protein L24 [Candidatus Walczuchella monophlebidarum]|uniref:Large ribosomal subunit protein uL24 n=1 Tax=Candidatus Walczuchella monophlebidarum TaxID=1415657 RepID=A0A068DSJ8_9FLAO|nr:50S ribosomal protein L24 [Candidatus Walczuchella monophlebidarum]AID37354.1 ribosomal protein L24 [Candidatus Walczuchella monophlebidarum]
MKSKIKKGDKIIVLSGNYKGVKGRVIAVFPQNKTAIVKGVNLIKQHIKPHDHNTKGEIIKRESPISLSKISVVDPDSGKPTRIGFHLKDGKKFRIAKRSGKIL